MYKIELKCSCGASIALEDATGKYIHTGGALDVKGRRFTIERMADDWLDRHRKCLEREQETKE